MKFVAIPAIAKLQQIRQIIANEEAYGQIFRSSVIRHDARGSYNAAGFEYFCDADYPPDFSLINARQGPPERHRLQWHGRMLIDDQPQHMMLYRQVGRRIADRHKRQALEVPSLPAPPAAATDVETRRYRLTAWTSFRVSPPTEP